MALGLVAKGLMGAGKAASGAKMAKNIFKSSFVKGFTLSDVEMTDVISFLKSLTDITFIKNQNYGIPKEFSATP